MVIVTPQKEKYKCIIPTVLPREQDDGSSYSGPGPLELIQPLFTLSGCSIRMDSYWTYEICHGYYIKQFHEEREGKVNKIQEYWLGRWDQRKSDELQKEIIARGPNAKLKETKIDGAYLPYLEIEMTDGTECDLSKKPRVTKVLYVCYPQDKSQIIIYSFKETSTCNYEIVILTNNLCSHPQYRPKVVKENVINCLPLNGAPTRPRALLRNVIENLKLRYQKITVSLVLERLLDVAYFIFA